MSLLLLALFDNLEYFFYLNHLVAIALYIELMAYDGSHFLDVTIVLLGHDHTSHYTA